MGQDNFFNNQQGIQPVNVRPTFSQPPIRQNPFGDDVEVIDLDDPRRDVKPTTWHRK